ncbi:translation initiation factor IF-2-like, partial [Penaeus japonicus]|uniref:translation initiation factor IF-2-like n=1 Tax=Penaeus japonicus TaxID=27405 RepID=UPI001C70F68B
MSLSLYAPTSSIDIFWLRASAVREHQQRHQVYGWSTGLCGQAARPGPRPGRRARPQAKGQARPVPGQARPRPGHARPGPRPRPGQACGQARPGLQPGLGPGQARPGQARPQVRPGQVLRPDAGPCQGQARSRPDRPGQGLGARPQASGRPGCGSWWPGQVVALPGCVVALPGCAGLVSGQARLGYV